MINYCHYVKENGEWIFIPVCSGGAHGGPGSCLCATTSERLELQTRRVDQLELQMRAIESFLEDRYPGEGSFVANMLTREFRPTGSSVQFLKYSEGDDRVAEAQLEDKNMAHSPVTVTNTSSSALEFLNGLEIMLREHDAEAVQVAGEIIEHDFGQENSEFIVTLLQQINTYSFDEALTTLSQLRSIGVEND